MADEVRAQHDRSEQAGEKPRRLGVTWQNLTVTGVDSSATFSENVLSQLYAFHKTRSAPIRTILDNSFGCAKPGEMLLVLGCTTLLNVLSNNRLGYREFIGDVNFGTMSPKEAEAYRGQIIMNTEEEMFYPMLTVQDTIHISRNKNFLLRLAGIPHAVTTKVGDAFHRGISGGERKRVSILECLATRGRVFCWDNSTRSLNASTALEWIKAMRVMTDVLGLTTIVTLYQAGNGIYETVDKVLVLVEGKQIYYGPRQEALPFMHDGGFLKLDGSDSADFLNGVTVPTERIITHEHQSSFGRRRAHCPQLLAGHACDVSGVPGVPLKSRGQKEHDSFEVFTHRPLLRS